MDTNVLILLFWELGRWFCAPREKVDESRSLAYVIL
jgi:hypothetical protein